MVGRKGRGRARVGGRPTPPPPGHPPKTGPRREDVLVVGFQERLAEDFERLKPLLGLPAAAALPRDPVESHRSPEGAHLRLSDAGRANLARWYADDIAFYERCKGLF